MLVSEVNSNEIDSNFTARETQDWWSGITSPSYKQPSKLSQLQTRNWIYLQWLPCHFTLNRDKIALSNSRQKCKTGKRSTTTANFSERNLGDVIARAGKLRKKYKYSQSLHATEIGISSGLMGHFTVSTQTLSYQRQIFLNRQLWFHWTITLDYALRTIVSAAKKETYFWWAVFEK